MWIGAKGGKEPNKRGQLFADGKVKQATQVSWELYVGPIPSGFSVLHVRECNIGLCVRFEHLYLGTQKENVADSLATGALHFDGLPRARTHCRFGHLLLQYPSGRRYCPDCKLKWGKRYYQKTGWKKRMEQRQIKAAG